MGYLRSARWSRNLNCQSPGTNSAVVKATDPKSGTLSTLAATISRSPTIDSLPIAILCHQKKTGKDYSAIDTGLFTVGSIYCSLIQLELSNHTRYVTSMGCCRPSSLQENKILGHFFFKESSLWTHPFLPGYPECPELCFIQYVGSAVPA